jgi:hypothetical protein
MRGLRYILTPVTDLMELVFLMGFNPLPNNTTKVLVKFTTYLRIYHEFKQAIDTNSRERTH